MQKALHSIQGNLKQLLNEDYSEQYANQSKTVRDKREQLVSLQAKLKDFHFSSAHPEEISALREETISVFKGLTVQPFSSVTMEDINIVRNQFVAELSVKELQVKNIYAKETKAEKMEVENFFNIQQFIEQEIKFNPKNLLLHLPQQNPNFLPREKYSLEGIKKLLDSSTSPVAGVLITGMPGTGKSQIAVAYAYHFIKDYDVIVPLKAGGKDLLGEYKRIFSSLLVDADLLKKEKLLKDLKEDTLVELIHRVLAANFCKILYIFDNVDKYESILPFIPKNQIGTQNIIHCIFTSLQVSGWPDWISENYRDVKPFTLDEAKNYILNILPDSDGDKTSNLAVELAETLYKYPLAIAQAVAYIKQPNFVNTIKDYLEQYKNASEYLLEINSLPKDLYERSVLTAWTVVKETMIASNPIAIELLELCSYLYSDEIELSLFTCYQNNQLLAALDFLNNHSLITPLAGKKAFLIHQMCQLAIRFSHKKERERIFNKILKIVYDSFKDILKPYSCEIFENAILLHPSIPDIIVFHAASLIEHSITYNLQSKLSIDLIFRLINFQFFVNHDKNSTLKYINYIEQSHSKINIEHTVQHEQLVAIRDWLDFPIEELSLQYFLTSDTSKSFSSKNRIITIKSERGIKNEPKNIWLTHATRRLFKEQIVDEILYVQCIAGTLDILSTAFRIKKGNVLCEETSILKIVDSSVNCSALNMIGQKNSKMYIQNSTIAAEKITIICKENSILLLSETSINGTDIIILCRENSHLDIRNSILKAERITILCQVNCTLSLSETYMKGKGILIGLEENSYIKRMFGVFVISEKFSIHVDDQLPNLISGLRVRCEDFLLHGGLFLVFNAFIIAKKQTLEGSIYFLLKQVSLFLAEDVSMKEIRLYNHMVITKEQTKGSLSESAFSEFEPWISKWSAEESGSLIFIGTELLSNRDRKVKNMNFVGFITEKKEFPEASFLSATIFIYPSNTLYELFLNAEKYDITWEEEGSFEKQVGKLQALSDNNNIERDNSIQQLEALLEAIQNNDLDNIRALLKYVDVNARHPRTQITALHQAAIHSHNDVVKEVLEILFAAGADPKLRWYDETPSECATSNDRPDVAELIEQAELNRIKKKDQTVLNKSIKILNRKGLANISSNQLIALLNLSDETSVGAAVDDGGCGFDALAQCLGGSHTEKSLRLACHKYYLNLPGEDNKKAVDDWIKKLGTNNPNIGDVSYLLVQYTGEELNPIFSIKGNPTWFTQEIDGRILCHAMPEVLPNGIHVIEITLNPESVGHYVITKDGYSQIEEEDKIKALYALPTLVVSNRHFVPLWSKEKVPVMQNYPLEIQKNQDEIFQQMRTTTLETTTAARLGEKGQFFASELVNEMSNRIWREIEKKLAIKFIEDWKKLDKNEKRNQKESIIALLNEKLKLQSFSNYLHKLAQSTIKNQCAAHIAETIVENCNELDSLSIEDWDIRYGFEKLIKLEETTLAASELSP